MNLDQYACTVVHPGIRHENTVRYARDGVCGRVTRALEATVRRTADLAKEAAENDEGAERCSASGAILEAFGLVDPTVP